MKTEKTKLGFVSISKSDLNIKGNFSNSACVCNNNDGCNYDEDEFDDLYIKGAPSFTYGDFLDNMHYVPSVLQKKNIELLAKNILQPIQSHFKKPVIIQSGIRGLDKKPIKNADTSLHQKGLAVDFIVKDVEIAELMKFISEKCNYKEAIICNYESKRPYIHVSYLEEKNEKERSVTRIKPIQKRMLAWASRKDRNCIEVEIINDSVKKK